VELKLEVNVEKQVGHLIGNNVILDNYSKVEVKNTSLGNILLGVLAGALVGLLVVGIIAVALIFAYGTGGVGPFVLGLFGGIGAIATWTSVAVIGAGIVGLCSTIGGFIGGLFSPVPKEIEEVNQALFESENNNGSINTFGDLGGKTHQNENVIQPANPVVDKSDDLGQKTNDETSISPLQPSQKEHILSMSKEYLKNMKNKDIHNKNGKTQAVSNIISAIDTDDMDEICHQLICLEKTVKVLGLSSEQLKHKKETLDYLDKVSNVIVQENNNQDNTALGITNI
jgi:hypothetical protein